VLSPKEWVRLVTVAVKSSLSRGELVTFKSLGALKRTPTVTSEDY